MNIQARNTIKAPQSPEVGAAEADSVAMVLLHMKDTSHSENASAKSTVRKANQKALPAKRKAYDTLRSVTDDEADHEDTPVFSFRPSSVLPGSVLARMALKGPPRLPRVAKKKSTMAKIKTLPAGRPLSKPFSLPGKEQLKKIQPIQIQLE